jgi:hypothetical protein
MRPQAAPSTGRTRRIVAFLFTVILLPAFVISFSGCIPWYPMTTASVTVVIKDCRTDQSYYHSHPYTNTGGDVFRFENRDDMPRRIIFPRWPFIGLPHTIYIPAHSVTHLYPLYQFCNQTAHADTFYFKVLDGDACGPPPDGPGIITDE